MQMKQMTSIGASLLDAHPIFTFEVEELWDGINMVAVMIGMFTFSEMIRLSKQTDSIAGKLLTHFYLRKNYADKEVDRAQNQRKTTVRVRMQAHTRSNCNLLRH